MLTTLTVSTSRFEIPFVAQVLAAAPLQKRDINANTWGFGAVSVVRYHSVHDSSERNYLTGSMAGGLVPNFRGGYIVSATPADRVPKFGGRR